MHWVREELRGRWSTLTLHSWARLLERFFDIDVTTCSHCGGPLKIIGAITEPPLIRKILTAMGLSPHPPPRSPARYDPQAEATLS